MSFNLKIGPKHIQILQDKLCLTTTYNGSMFDLRFKYNEVFPQFVGEEDELEEARNDQY